MRFELWFMSVILIHNLKACSQICTSSTSSTFWSPTRSPTLTNKHSSSILLSTLPSLNQSTLPKLFSPLNNPTSSNRSTLTNNHAPQLKSSKHFPITKSWMKNISSNYWPTKWWILVLGSPSKRSTNIAIDPSNTKSLKNTKRPHTSVKINCGQFSILLSTPYPTLRLIKLFMES